jgi:glycosyltransferase involved in cell wall biosynthesis
MDKAVGHIDAGGGINPGDVLLVRASGLLAASWYLGHEPDLARQGIDPAVHFCTIGWRRNRNPNPYFDTAYYLATNPDVAGAGLNPLVHYINHGDDEGRAPSPHFHTGWYREHYGIQPGTNCLAHFLSRRLTGAVNPVPLFNGAFYLETYPDVAAAQNDPFEHFLTHGYLEARNPAPGFDTKFYLARYRSELRDQNPLLHYLANRHRGTYHATRPEHERLLPGAVKHATRPSADFEEFRPIPQAAQKRAKLLAYYLPQFHPIAENDTWWGKGFTDWVNLARALPRFVGHYLPRVPRDLGFYSLDDPRTLRRQIDMAKGAGLGGFIFYFYWFNGRRLLEGPLQQLLDDPTLNFPFCLMWANENWTRRWDGLEREVLLAQEYRLEDDEALVDCFASYFRDERYIRLQGRPLLMVYRASVVPNSQETVARWRQLFAERHDENPIFVMAQSFGDIDPAVHGMESAIEFPPHKLVVNMTKINDRLDILDPDFDADVYEYDEMIAESLNEPPPAFPLIKTLTLGWDNDARREGKGLVLHQATPAKYQNWLERLVAHARTHKFFGEPIVCVNAWNEWAEGAYLEPDIHYGSAFLNATGRAITGVVSAETHGKLLLVGHDALPHGAQMLLLNLARHYRRTSGLDLHILLLGAGPLTHEYSALGTLNIAPDEPTLRRFFARYRDLGVRDAIVNTAAAARVCAMLEDYGIGSTLMIHEMPRLIAEKSLQGQARQGMSTARRVIFSSDYVRTRLCETLQVSPRQSLIMPQGNYQKNRFSLTTREKMRAELGIGPDAFVVLAVGFADMRKGFDIFLQVWRLIMQARGDVYFIWVGDLHLLMQDYLSAEIEAAQASGRFMLIPFTDDVAAYYDAADVYALTSREDPFPTVVIEALAAGVPSVAFESSGGIPDMLRSERIGYVAPVGDAPAFAVAVASLFDHDRLAADRARLIKFADERFNFAEYARRLLSAAHATLKPISACVLSYNYERHMRARLSSVFGQTYPVAEVLVLDDASEDGSVAEAQNVAASWQRDIEIIRNTENSGSVFAQWQRAAQAAHGEYIWLAEADDACEPRFLERLIDAMALSDHAVMAFTDSRAVDAEGATLMADYQRYYAESGVRDLAVSGVWKARDFAVKFLAERNLILNVSAVLWRRSALLAALEACGPALHALRLAGDWRVYLALLAAGEGEVIYVAEPLNVHRRHREAVTQMTDAERHVSEIEAMQQIARASFDLPAATQERQAQYLETISIQLGARSRAVKTKTTKRQLPSGREPA